MKKPRKRQTIQGKEKNCARLECGYRINEETQTEQMLEIKKIGNLNRDYRGKHHQQNTRNGTISDVEYTTEKMDTLVKKIC